MPEAGRLSPAPAAWITPAMMASTTSPSTSSITAAPRMIRALGGADRLRLLQHARGDPDRGGGEHRAQEGVHQPGLVGQQQAPDAEAERHRGGDPDHRHERRRQPDREHLARRRLEAHLEQQQDRAELGEDREALARLERDEPGPAHERQVSEHDAEHQLAENGGLAQARREQAHELGAHQHQRQRREHERLLAAERGGADQQDRHF